MAEPKTYDELERLAGSGRLLGAPCCHRGSASSSWAALKERAAASVFEGRTPHRSSCRRHAEEERRPSTEIRPGVYLPLIAYEPSPAFLPQPAFVGERDPPTEDWMEKYKPHPRLTRGSFTDKGDECPDEGGPLPLGREGRGLRATTGALRPGLDGHRAGGVQRA